MLALVSFGAEVIADGSIHVYAPLRGRAHRRRERQHRGAHLLHCMQAQLLAIAGIFRTTDEALPDGIVGQAAMVRLDGRQLAVERLADRTTTKQEEMFSMAKVIVVTSGKGGVGKTTTSASFASGLALRGHKTAVIDFDVGLRNLDLIMGCERRVVYDLVNVIHGEAKLTQALIKDKHMRQPVRARGLADARQGRADQGRRRARLDELDEMGFEYIVCDSPAGIETGAPMAMYFADEAIVVTNPEVSSVRDSDRILGMLAAKTQRAIDGKEGISEHLLITRYDPARVASGQMLSIDDIQEILRIPLIGVVPESQTVLNASNQGVPAIHMKGSAVPRPTRTWCGASSARAARCASRSQAADASSNACSQRPARDVLAFVAVRQKKKSASLAKQRLQIVLAHERGARGQPPADYLPTLQRELQWWSPNTSRCRRATSRCSCSGATTTSRCSRSRCGLPQAAAR